jgi:hypothetical protein
MPLLRSWFRYFFCVWAIEIWLLRSRFSIRSRPGLGFAEAAGEPRRSLHGIRFAVEIDITETANQVGGTKALGRKLHARGRSRVA